VLRGADLRRVEARLLNAEASGAGGWGGGGCGVGSSFAWQRVVVVRERKAVVGRSCWRWRVSARRQVFEDAMVVIVVLR
jgi:hypothetical protein